MPLPDLEAYTPLLFETCDTVLGDTITITSPSNAVVTVKVHATHRDRRVDFGISAANVQDAMIDIDMAAIVGKPGTGWRVTLPRIPGKIFEPRDVQRDDSGLRWEFGLKQVPNA
jgi:hypothetical protein